MRSVKNRFFKGLYISKHAEIRAQTRLQMTFNELCESACNSLEEGIDALGDPTLRSMVIQRALKYNASGIYAYKGAIYIFVEASLVTVYPLQWIAIPDRSVA